MPSPSTAGAAAQPSRGRSLRGVKLAVIAMGAVIVIGFIVVVATIVQRLAGPATPGDVGVIGVPVAKGCWIADAWSADGKLYLRLDGDGACRQVAIVDEAQRKVIGLVVAVEPNAAPAAAPVPAPAPAPAP